MTSTPDVDVPLESQTKESLIALARSLITQAEERGKRKEAEEQVIQRSRDVVIFWSLSFDKKATQEEVIRTIQELAKSLVDLKALTLAPEEK